MTTGTLGIDGSAGRSTTVVEVIGETPTRTRIRALTRMRPAGRDRWLNPGDGAGAEDGRHHHTHR